MNEGTQISPEGAGPSVISAASPARLRSSSAPDSERNRDSAARAGAMSASAPTA